MRTLAAVLSLALVGSLSLAQPAPVAAPPKSPNQLSENLATQLKTFIRDSLPDPLFEDTKKWGLQKKFRNGRVENEGRWHKIRVVGRDLQGGLVVEVTNYQKVQSKSQFQVGVHFDVLFHLDRQTWKRGVRIYSGSTRARTRVHLNLLCEIESKSEKKPGAWLPDLILQFRVLHSFFDYDRPKVEHTAGVGGEAAEILGDIMLGLLKTIKPELEGKLKQKINDAVLKAGQNKQVRINFSEWLNSKE
jgi:hypothetical protein